jgi:hypothetical protein
MTLRLINLGSLLYVCIYHRSSPTLLRRSKVVIVRAITVLTPIMLIVLTLTILTPSALLLRQLRPRARAFELLPKVLDNLTEDYKTAGSNRAMCYDANKRTIPLSALRHTEDVGGG